MEESVKAQEDSESSHNFFIQLPDGEFVFIPHEASVFASLDFIQEYERIKKENVWTKICKDFLNHPSNLYLLGTYMQYSELIADGCYLPSWSSELG